MAAVPITIVGIETRDDGSTCSVTIVGVASLTGLGVGGGPAQPPLGMWGPSDPRPTNPIAGWNPGTGTWPTPPTGSGGGPVDPGYSPPWAQVPTEPPPTGEAGEDGFLKPPPEDGGWGYHEEYGWLYSPGADKATPKKRSSGQQ